MERINFSLSLLLIFSCFIFPLYSSEKHSEILIQELKSENLDAKINAVKSISKTKDRKIIAQLISILKNETEDENLRSEVIRALGKVNNQQAVKAIVDTLQDRNYRLKHVSIETLGKTKNSLTVNLLLKALSKSIKTKECSLCLEIILALGKIRDIRTAKPLFKIFKHEDPIVSAAVSWALGQLRTPPLIRGKVTSTELGGNIQSVRYRVNRSSWLDAIPSDGVLDSREESYEFFATTGLPYERIKTGEYLIEIKSLNERGEIDAVYSVVRFKVVDVPEEEKIVERPAVDESAMEALISLLEDKNPEIRAKAGWALGEMKVQKSKELLESVIKDEKNEDILKILAAVLEIIKSSDAPATVTKEPENIRKEDKKNVIDQLRELQIISLIEKLKAESSSVRSQAVDELAGIKDPRVIKALMITLEKDDDKYVRSKTASALGTLGDRTAVSALISTLKKDTDPEVRQNAAMALKDLRDPKAIQQLIASFKDENPEVRLRSAIAVGEMGKSAIIPLTKVVNNKNTMMRLGTVIALGRIKDKRVIKPLISALNDKSWTVRDQAALALGRQKRKNAVVPLIASLKDSNFEVRARAAWALGEIKATGARKSLERALKDESKEVQREAEAALKKIKNSKFSKP